VLQNILIETEKQSFKSLSLRSDESINDDSSFLQSPAEEAPKIPADSVAEINRSEAKENNITNNKEEDEEGNVKPAKEDSLVAAVNKDKAEKAAFESKLDDQLEKFKSVLVDSNEEENLLKEKIRINSIEILINIVTLTPSINYINYIIYVCFLLRSSFFLICI